MLTRRIIPCLDVKKGKVIKGVQFKNHKVMGEIVELAQYYADSGADELVFYDITASTQDRSVSCEWITRVARAINIPFCVAGGIRSVDNARALLQAGADKISINSPALETPQLIDELVAQFGKQCVVIGIDSFAKDDDYWVYQYTGDPSKTIAAHRRTLDWVNEVQQRGAGEIVLNCINQDGVRKGYDIEQLSKVRQIATVPLIASGGAGTEAHFSEVFKSADVSGALAASVFHSKKININQLKQYLKQEKIEVRL